MQAEGAIGDATCCGAQSKTELASPRQRRVTRVDGKIDARSFLCQSQESLLSWLGGSDGPDCIRRGRVGFSSAEDRAAKNFI
jgi:hypothetical protein